METTELGHCPKCGEAMKRGFAVRKAPLSWVEPQQLARFIFLDRDLHENGLRQYLPGKAEYDLSYVCTQCRIYLVDYSRALSRAEAEDLARTM